MRNLIRWVPRNEMSVSDPFRSFDELFEDLWRNGPSRLFSDTARPLLRPAMDVIENDKELTIRVDLPGLKAENLKVEVNDGVLTINGEMGDTIEREGERYHYRERSYGSFQRSLRLPNTLDSNNVDATFENGVLNVTLLKLPEAQPKQITVKTDKK
ncbi:MAG: Hsp20/alpha crystallin family protein [Chloroflexi bacterium]|nr:Hsp20/alpha crystallin family protein [Chloroflexota bacterium]